MTAEKALNKHIREVIREGIREPDELINESHKAYKLRVIQIGVEITLN